MQATVKWVRIILLGCVLSLAGACAVSKAITGPDGQTLHAINCSGWDLTMGDCLEKAGKICGAAGYDIISGGTENHGTMFNANQYGMLGGPMIRRELIVRCKDVKGNPSPQDQP